ncbi:5-methylcytosine-specific restriction endonuclease McrBC regulatory subunit McrC [Xanthomonas arboricola]
MQNSFKIDGVGLPLNWFDPTSLTDAECAQLQRLVEWEYKSENRCYWIRRKAPHKVGRIVCGRRVLSVVPDMGNDDFMTLFLYSLGVDVSRFAGRNSSSIDLSANDGDIDYSHLIAALMAAACENAAAGYVAKSYERKIDRLLTLRGRVDWLEFIRTPKHLGLACEFHEITTDSLINRVVLEGLKVALTLNAPNGVIQRLSKLEFTWQSLCTRKPITLQDINSCEKSLNRLTENYRPVLALCRMLLFDLTPSDFFAGGRGELQVFEFDLSGIFERFVRELLKSRFYLSLLEVRYQSEDGLDILDGAGSLYQKARPDFSIECDGNTIAVLDAKFKPRYVSLSDGGKFKSSNRLDSSDVYQMLFYIDRASSGRTVPGYVICPLMDTAAERPTEAQSTIVWKRGSIDEIVIRVVDVNLPDTLQAIRSNAQFPMDGLSALCEELLASCG